MSTKEKQTSVQWDLMTGIISAALVTAIIGISLYLVGRKGSPRQLEHGEHFRTNLPTGSRMSQFSDEYYE